MGITLGAAGIAAVSRQARFCIVGIALAFEQLKH